MTPEQFDLIVDQRFSRLNTATIDACKAVIIGGLSAYSAEDAYKCGRGTVSRYVNKIHAEYSLAVEISGNLEQRIKKVLKDHPLWDGETANQIAEIVNYE